MLVALTADVFGLLLRLAGLTHDAAALRHARPAFVVAAIVAQAASLASFPVSHVTPVRIGDSTLLNVGALEAEGVTASTTTEGIGLTSLVSTVALIALFGTGLWRRPAGTCPGAT